LKKKKSIYSVLVEVTAYKIIRTPGTGYLRDVYLQNINYTSIKIINRGVCPACIRPWVWVWVEGTKINMAWTGQSSTAFQNGLMILFQMKL
jgi:hypothetical protein